MTEITDLHRNLVDGLNTAVLLLDERFAVRYMNPAAESLLALSLPRMLGRDIRSTLSPDPDDRAALESAVSDAAPFTKRRARIFDGLGHELVVDYSVTPLQFDSHPTLLVELQDIDRLLRISREELLLATHDTTRQLVRGLAHEIKNPLGGIKGAAQLLDAELDNPELSEYTQVIADEVDRLRNLVDRMLGPNKPPAKEQINIHEVIERVITLIGAECGGRIRLRKDYDPSLPDLNVDREMLLQAFLNIARNAMQALIEARTPDPGICFLTRIERRVAIAGQLHRLVCRVEIIDNGPGIDPRIIDEVFYPMITGRSEGTGLGLSIAQALVHEHGGIIECASQPGRTQFSILLPVEKRGPRDRPAA